MGAPWGQKWERSLRSLTQLFDTALSRTAFRLRGSQELQSLAWCDAAGTRILIKNGLRSENELISNEQGLASQITF